VICEDWIASRAAIVRATAIKDRDRDHDAGRQKLLASGRSLIAPLEHALLAKGTIVHGAAALDYGISKALPVVGGLFSPLALFSNQSNDSFALAAVDPQDRSAFPFAAHWARQTAVQQSIAFRTQSREAIREPSWLALQHFVELFLDAEFL
jgi:hypothetical protein